MKKYLYITLITVTLMSIYSTAGAGDFEKSYQFLKERIPESSLNDLYIKGHRVQLWETFSKNLYDMLKEGGNRKEGDLFENPSYSILLLTIDEEYRKTGEIIHIKKNPLLGIEKSKWVSLQDMDEKIFPSLKNKLSIISDEREREQFIEVAEKISWRVNAVRDMSFETLWLINTKSNKEVWLSIENCEDEQPVKIYRNLIMSYQKKNGDQFEHQWNNLFSYLKENQHIEEEWKFTVERIYNRLPLMTITFFTYLIASVLLFFYIPLQKKNLEKLSFILIIVGFISHFLFLTLRSIIGWHLPVTGMYEFISLLAWSAVLINIIIQLRYKTPIIGAIVVPVSLILIVIASLFPKQIDTQLIPALKSYWLTIHVILASIGEGAFAIGFASALFFLLKKSDEKSGMLPGKDRLEEIAYKSVLIGYPFFTIGALVAGAIWAEQAWGSWWSWDPKETCSLIVWLFATAYLHARIARGWRGRRSAILVVIIFGLSLFTLFSNLIFGGLHSYGTG